MCSDFIVSLPTRALEATVRHALAGIEVLKSQHYHRIAGQNANRGRNSRAGRHR